MKRGGLLGFSHNRRGCPCTSHNLNESKEIHMFRNHPARGTRAYRQALAALAIVLMLPTAFACGKDSATAPQDNLFGAYSLSSVDGEDLPVTVFDGQGRLPDGKVVTLKAVVLDSEIDLDEEGSYFIAIMLRVTVNGNTATQSISNEGQFERSGSRIEFESDDPDISDFSGTLSRGKLTLRLDIMGNGDEYDYEYSKGT